MAARTLYPAQDAMNWSAAEWSLADDNAKNQAKPAGGDTVYFTANSGDVTLDENSAALGTLDMYSGSDYAGTLSLGGFTLAVDGNCYLKGTIAGTGTIDAGEGDFYQVAAVADAIVLLLTTSGPRAISWTGTGGSVNINCTGTYTLATACDSYALTVTAGTLAGGAQEWTVGAGGFTFTDGIISGTLDVDLSGAAGAYTQTDGEVAAAAVLNVTTGSGGWTFTALTLTGALNMTVASSVTANWDTTTAPITKLTINPSVTLTQSGHSSVVRLDGGATSTLAAETYLTRWYPAAASDWSFTGTMTGTSFFQIRATTTPLTMTSAINVGTRPVSTPAAAFAMTLPGFTGGDLAVAPTSAGTITITINGNSTGGAIALGTAAAADRLGAVVFGSGFVHRWTGAIARSGTGTTNAITFGGWVYLGGNVTLAGIVPNFGSAFLLGAKTLPTINGATAGTVANVAAVIARMTITNLTGPAANKIVAYSHRGERVHFDNRLPAKARDGLNCKLSTGNSNILSRLVVARQPNFIRASSRRVRRCARGTGRGRISLTRKDTLHN